MIVFGGSSFATQPKEKFNSKFMDFMIYGEAETAFDSLIKNLDNPSKVHSLVYEKDGEEIEELVETVAGNYNIFYENVFNAIRKGADLLVKPEETAEVLKILEACLKSNSEKRTIQL